MRRELCQLSTPGIPKCVVCGYALDGLPADQTRRVRCPECGTIQPTWRRHVGAPISMSQFVLWCCLPPVVLCSCCTLILVVAGENSTLYAAAFAAMMTGVISPAIYAWRLWATRPSTPPLVIFLLMLLGFGINGFIGLCFVLWAAGYLTPPWD